MCYPYYRSFTSREHKQRHINISQKHTCLGATLDGKDGGTNRFAENHGCFDFKEDNVCRLRSYSKYSKDNRAKERKLEAIRRDGMKNA
mmetsp:Transcript_39621/g.92706  ORF Transcript_39621/g.92706 Transcript_39621/m.92706 type:complete len:88 (-) Transcript_39621:7-270(-)